MAASQKTPIYVLSIDDENGPRRQHIETEFNRTGYGFEFVDGLRSCSPEIDAAYSRWRNILFAKRSMSSTEIAVYLGHRRIWKSILNSDYQVALVIEDDVEVIDPDSLSIIIQNSDDNATWDILKLFDYKPKTILNRQEWHGMSIVDYKYPASGCVAYLITRNAARRLLMRKKIYRPVDEDFSWCWEFGLRVRSISPNICTEVSHRLGGSLIEQSRLVTKRETPLLRRLNGNLLAAIKQLRAKKYLDRVIAAGR